MFYHNNSLLFHPPNIQELIFFVLYEILKNMHENKRRVDVLVNMRKVFVFIYNSVEKMSRILNFI